MGNYTKTLVDEHKKSKYSIAKKLHVSWNTVSLWYKGVYLPTESHNNALLKLIEQEAK